MKTDLFDRGIPWTLLLLRRRFFPNDLNVSFSQRLCVVLVYLLLVMLVGLGISLVTCPTTGSLDWALHIVKNDPLYKEGARDIGDGGEITPDVKRFVIQMYERYTGRKLLTK